VSATAKVGGCEPKLGAIGEIAAIGRSVFVARALFRREHVEEQVDQLHIGGWARIQNCTDFSIFDAFSVRARYHFASKNAMSSLRELVRSGWLTVIYRAWMTKFASAKSSHRRCRDERQQQKAEQIRQSEPRGGRITIKNQARPGDLPTNCSFFQCKISWQRISGGSIGGRKTRQFFERPVRCLNSLHRHPTAPRRRDRGGAGRADPSCYRQMAPAIDYRPALSEQDAAALHRPMSKSRRRPDVDPGFFETMANAFRGRRGEGDRRLLDRGPAVVEMAAALHARGNPQTDRDKAVYIC